MPITPHPDIPPEVLVADDILGKMHRSRFTSEADLWKKVNWKDPHERELYNEFREIALEALVKEKYIEPQHAVGLHNNPGTQYRLSPEGRELLNAGGYLASWRKKHQLEFFGRKVSTAEGKRKIWDNRSKYFAFGLAIFSALVLALGLLEKYSADSKRRDAATQLISANDSALKHTRAQFNDSVRAPFKRHHPKNSPTEHSAVSGSPSGSSSPDQKLQNSLSLPAPNISSPIQVTTSDDIEFRLLKVQGNLRTQSITITLTLTNTAATKLFSSNVRTIIDTEGNEYKLKSWSLGTETITPMIELTTGVPLKCTFIFGNILGNVKMIRLFEYGYFQSGNRISVDFRDLPVDWK